MYEQISEELLYLACVGMLVEVCSGRTKGGYIKQIAQMPFPDSN